MHILNLFRIGELLRSFKTIFKITLVNKSHEIVVIPCITVLFINKRNFFEMSNQINFLIKKIVMY